ncbi:MAG: hypothetical protein AAGE80_00445 [Pseudomonadota bacterium]
MKLFSKQAIDWMLLFLFTLMFWNSSSNLEHAQDKPMKTVRTIESAVATQDFAKIDLYFAWLREDIQAIPSLQLVGFLGLALGIPMGMIMVRMFERRYRRPLFRAAVEGTEE